MLLRLSTFHCHRVIYIILQAVSYTHLDVYKRQVLLFRKFTSSFGIVTATGILNLLRQDFRVTARTLKMQDRYFFMSVSYTHLDVYKRQTLMQLLMLQAVTLKTLLLLQLLKV